MHLLAGDNGSHSLLRDTPNSLEQTTPRNAKHDLHDDTVCGENSHLECTDGFAAVLTGTSTKLVYCPGQ